MTTRKPPRPLLSALLLSLCTLCGGGEAGAQAPSPAAARPRIGLALSGGGARGLAHIGVLKVLEELRVPVDYIAGTSMGAIVGGLYASGLPAAELERRVAAIDWASQFNDRPPRQELSQRRKEDDFRYPSPFELGLRDGRFGVARGAIEGGALDLTLRELTRPAMLVEDFDALPIPYRAVATDLADGQMVVFAHGRLHEAMRASMSVPGAFSPIEVDGRLLGDGGLTRNLPVDIVREMGAEIVIAVNIGTPLAARSTLTSALAVTRQMISILTEQNVTESLKTLSVRDILIAPALADISSMDFARAAEISAQGADAARAARNLLAYLALDEAAYAAHVAERKLAAEPATRVDFVEFTPSGLVNPDVLRQQMQTRAEGRFDMRTLHADIAVLQGRGDFERIDYRLARRDGRNGVLLDAVEKSWGPNYLRFGVTFSTDFRGDSAFHMRVGHTRTWLNSYGAEWRNELQIGRDRQFQTEFYQPLSPAQTFFVAPSYQHERRLLDLFEGDQRAAQYERSENRLGIDFGAPVGKWGEARIGYSHADIKGYPLIALSLFPHLRYRENGIRVRGVFDQLDSATFANHGARVEYEALVSRRSLGGDTDYTRQELQAVAAATFGRHTLTGGLRVAGYAGSDLPQVPEYSLGGFQQLSGYRDGQLRDYQLGLARVAYSTRIGEMPALGRGIYIGGSLEAGNVWASAGQMSLRGLKYGMSLFFAADTTLGPLYFAYGRSSGSGALYLFLGRP